MLVAGSSESGRGGMRIVVRNDTNFFVRGRGKRGKKGIEAPESEGENVHNVGKKGGLSWKRGGRLILKKYCLILPQYPW